MALARLVYEFPSQLQPLVPQLLAPILSLLRSKSREVIKSVLGFVKVRVYVVQRLGSVWRVAARAYVITRVSLLLVWLPVFARTGSTCLVDCLEYTCLCAALCAQVLAVRMPVDLLRPHLGPILEGVLLWAADSKNKFKLKVRGGRAGGTWGVRCYL
jgi:hypothetical protein